MSRSDCFCERSCGLNPVLTLEELAMSFLLPLFFASRSVGEDITVMSAFNLLHLVTKSQPAALRACGLPSGSCRDKKNCKVVFSQQELRKRLTPLQYHVTQEKGTESAFEGEYTHHKDPGIYKCVVCGTPLFKSESKFDSGSVRRPPWAHFRRRPSSHRQKILHKLGFLVLHASRRQWCPGGQWGGQPGPRGQSGAVGSWRAGEASVLIAQLVKKKKYSELS
ncbi:methionine-R-sulfoxide reductase B3 isoform X1 [Mirounga leonina]|uniref:methionine-R-sulfoxide reductase B3 isoform X1 n=1 Tax=Mirounga leonina TaxID=9715 RepID=UPI00156C1A02|nr:methionine-R-sulfoxide reductase B3 isoform X1 [Mirounga leonina]